MDDWLQQQNIEEYGQYLADTPDNVLSINELEDKKTMNKEAPQFPMILICGESGSGKSTSLRNLEPNTTAILNTENKVLPFRHASNFKKKVSIEPQKELSAFGYFQEMLKRALAPSNTINTVVIDSFTSLTEMAYEHFIRYSSDKRSAWNDYADGIYDTLSMCKNSGKFVVFIAIDDMLMEEDSIAKKRVKIQGKKLQGAIEKEFEMVLFTHINTMAESLSNQYQFMTNTDGKNTAKTPMGMFDDLLIPNDLQHVLETAYEYFNDKPFNNNKEHAA